MEKHWPFVPYKRRVTNFKGVIKERVHLNMGDDVVGEVAVPMLTMRLVANSYKGGLGSANAAGSLIHRYDGYSWFAFEVSSSLFRLLWYSFLTCCFLPVALYLTVNKDFGMC